MRCILIIIFTFGLVVNSDLHAAPDEMAEISIQCENSANPATLIQPYQKMGYFECQRGKVFGVRAHQAKGGIPITVFKVPQESQSRAISGKKVEFSSLQEVAHRKLKANKVHLLKNVGVYITVSRYNGGLEPIQTLIDIEKQQNLQKAKELGLDPVIAPNSSYNKDPRPTGRKGEVGIKSDTCCVTCDNVTICAKVVIHDCGTCSV